jgi:glucokinase
MAFVGIDLGGTQLRVALASNDGRLTRIVRRESRADDGRDRVISRIVQAVADTLEEAHVRPQAVKALGIGLPGPVDPRLGVVHFAPNLPGWQEVPLNRILTQRTGIRSFLHHDAHLAAFAEYRRGAARSARDMAYVTVSTGIGAGFVLDGQLYAGSRGGAGEVGHTVIQPGGPRCTCGNRGCVEALASGWAIARDARAAVRAGRRTVLSRIPAPGPTARDVSHAARAGDRVARALLEAAGRALGIGMGTVVNYLNPSVLVIGGGVMNAGRLITVPMRRSMAESSWASSRRGLRIVRPALGKDVGLYGAVEWARHNTG